MRFKATTPHIPEPGDVLSVSAGEELRFERRATEYKGWVWGISGSGAAAWVPEAWVRIDGRRCTMLRDYVSREIELREGDEVTSGPSVAGWAWVRAGDGREGWAPLEGLESLGE